jgi:hypothetical protein
MTTQQRRRLPFDVAPRQVHRIVITPEIYGVMADESDETKEAIKLIEDHWVATADSTNQPEDDDFFGLTIPIRYGITAAEERALDQTLELQKKSSADVNLLAADVAEETGLPVSDVLRLIANSSVSIAPELLPYSGRFIEMQANNGEIDYEVKIATVLIRRVIPAWTDALSKVLHPAIMTAITAFEQQERKIARDGISPKSRPQLLAV